MLDAASARRLADCFQSPLNLADHDNSLKLTGSSAIGSAAGMLSGSMTVRTFLAREVQPTQTPPPCNTSPRDVIKTGGGKQPS